MNVEQAATADNELHRSPIRAVGSEKKRKKHNYIEITADRQKRHLIRAIDERYKRMKMKNLNANQENANLIL